MSRWLRCVLVLVVVAICAAAAATALAGNQREPLTGTWSGAISGGSSGRIVIVVNTRETGGSWRLGATCHGTLTLSSISNGYHHFRRKVAAGATCAGGDVDCLKRVGTNVYDAVTSHLGSAHDASGTLRRALR
jgi:hypothetical protein